MVITITDFNILIFTSKLLAKNRFLGKISRKCTSESLGVLPESAGHRIGLHLLGAPNAKFWELRLRLELIQKNENIQTIK